MNDELKLKYLHELNLLLSGNVSQTDDAANKQLELSVAKIAAHIQAGEDPNVFVWTTTQEDQIINDLIQTCNPALWARNEARGAIYKIQYNLDKNGGYGEPLLPLTLENEKAIDYVDAQLVSGIDLDKIDRNALPQVGVVIDLIHSILNPPPAPAPAPVPLTPPKPDNPLQKALKWLFKRPLRLPAKQARGIDRTFGLPAGTTEDANTAVGGAVATAAETAVTNVVEKTVAKI